MMRGLVLLSGLIRPEDKYSGLKSGSLVVFYKLTLKEKLLQCQKAKKIADKFRLQCLKLGALVTSWQKPIFIIMFLSRINYFC